MWKTEDVFAKPEVQEESLDFAEADTETAEVPLEPEAACGPGSEGEGRGTGVCSKFS